MKTFEFTSYQSTLIDAMRKNEEEIRDIRMMKHFIHEELVDSLPFMKAISLKSPVKIVLPVKSLSKKVLFPGSQSMKRKEMLPVCIILCGKMVSRLRN